MTALWLLGAAVALLAAGLLARRLVGTRGSTVGRHERAVIENLQDETGFDSETGAVCSIQRADLLIEERALSRIWTPADLERLARTYWRFLTHVTLGLIRVHYSEGERSVVLLIPPLRLLTFHAPEYEMDATRGLVRWRIARGLLVARRGRDSRGHLQIEVSRDVRAGPQGQARLHVEVEVANFYPSIASGLGLRLYNATQSRIHVIVTYGFLRSLARLDLAESRVGRFAAQP